MLHYGLRFLNYSKSVILKSTLCVAQSQFACSRVTLFFKFHLRPGRCASLCSRSVSQFSGNGLGRSLGCRQTPCLLFVRSPHNTYVPERPLSVVLSTGLHLLFFSYSFLHSSSIIPRLLKYFAICHHFHVSVWDGELKESAGPDAPSTSITMTVMTVHYQFYLFNAIYIHNSQSFILQTYSLSAIIFLSWVFIILVLRQDLAILPQLALN